MPATEAQITDAVRRVTAMRSYRDAERELEFAALCVVGTHTRQRRTWDDNHGGHPTRLVVTTGDPAKAVETYNRGVHSIDGLYHTLAYVWVRTRDHAEKMREWIETQIKGEPMLSGWTDIEPWQFEILFGAAADALGFETFDDQEKVRRVLTRARGRRWKKNEVTGT